MCICILLPQQGVREQVVGLVGKYMKELCKRDTLHVGNERVSMVMGVLKGLVCCASTLTALNAFNAFIRSLLFF